MHGLARIAMNGRFRALLLSVACFGSLLFAWIGAAIVALVTLRKGVQEGIWLLLWAGLPVLILTRVTGDGSSLALLLGTSLLALVLRETVSLSLTALCSVGVALLTGFGLLLFGQSLLVDLAALFEQFFASLQAQAQTQAQGLGTQALTLAVPSTVQLAGLMGTTNGAMCFLCIALARYWQASLFNPGGFGSEFRELRISRTMVFVLLLAGLAVASSGLAGRAWATAALIPLTIAGFALLHARAHQRSQGSFGLSLIYATWVVFDAVKLVLVGFVVADALLDFRSRWAGRGGPGNEQGTGEGTGEGGNGAEDPERDDDSR